MIVRKTVIRGGRTPVGPSPNSRRKAAALAAFSPLLIALVACVSEPELFSEPGVPEFSRPAAVPDGAMPPATPTGSEVPVAAEPAAPVPMPSEGQGPVPIDNAGAPPPVEPVAPSGEGISAPAEPVPPASPSPAPPSVDVDPTGQARICRAPAAPLLLDFEVVNNGIEQALFGDFQSVLSGGTYFYPAAGALPDAGLPPGLISDVTGGAWHLAGTITAQAGFGVFLDCELLDASAFAGIAFRVEGELGIGAPASITFMIGTAANDVSRAWLLERNGSAARSFGRCIPAQAQYDGTCTSARIQVPVSPEPQDLLVRFSELSFGSPDLGVNPLEITTIAWALPSPVLDPSGAVEPYAVDLRIDDIRFVPSE